MEMRHFKFLNGAQCQKPRVIKGLGKQFKACFFIYISVLFRHTRFCNDCQKTKGFQPC